MFIVMIDGHIIEYPINSRAYTHNTAEIGVRAMASIRASISTRNLGAQTTQYVLIDRLIALCLPSAWMAT
jgi:hypothetical protein